jgi:hypothetical protein
MAKAGSPEERKVPDVTEVQDLTLVEIGTCAVCSEIVCIHQAAIAAIG